MNKNLDEFSRLTYVTADDPPVKKAVISSIERLSGRKKLEKIYDNVLGDFTSGSNSFWEAALHHLDISLDYDPAQLAQIPAEGPIVFVANHPYGVLDGLTICYLASRVRQNFKILINSALCREERIEEYLLPIDFSETKEAVLRNIQSKREAMQTLKDGGAIVIFPAGGISTTLRPLGRGPVVDLEWKLFMAKMVKMSKAVVVPIFFHGQNGRMFQFVSRLSLTLRLSLILREVNKQRGGVLKVTIGDPMYFEELAHLKGREQLTLYLRKTVYELGHPNPHIAMEAATLERPRLKKFKFSRN
ncbi:MAG: lysophospholipid acyltransferase family protein [Ardenticatenaceae bacterium]|nr:lysophospholipid acyltransferase family protein [Ardenticatenaceae bacterium]